MVLDQVLQIKSPFTNLSSRPTSSVTSWGFWRLLTWQLQQIPRTRWSLPRTNSSAPVKRANFTTAACTRISSAHQKRWHMLLVILAQTNTMVSTSAFKATRHGKHAYFNTTSFTWQAKYTAFRAVLKKANLVSQKSNNDWSIMAPQISMWMKPNPKITFR